MNYLTKNIITGIYINTNYKYEPFLPEIPYIEDTLILYDNNTFYSNYWGKGVYQIEYSIKGTNLDLTYDYEFGKAGFHTRINREISGKTKIILFKQNDHCYKKID